MYYKFKAIWVYKGGEGILGEGRIDVVVRERKNFVTKGKQTS